MTAVLEKSSIDIDATNAVLDTYDPTQIVDWAAREFGGGLVMSSSFGAESALLIHLATRLLPDIRVVMIDTGYLFPETHQFMEELRQRFDLNVWVYRTRNDPIAYLKQAGENDPAIRVNVEGCCAVNKNEPFERAMHQLKPAAWLRGIRRNQAETRTDKQPVEWSKRYNCYAVSPLLNWSQREIHGYMKQHDLPYHPLYEKGYASIGCNPLTCTRPIQIGEDPRAGRWAGTNKIECGLHLEQGAGISRFAGHITVAGVGYNRPAMRFPSVILIFVALFACSASVAWAKVGLQLNVGWEGHYRAGQWNPVYVSAVSNDTRDVQLELYTPTDGRYAVRIAQQFAVSPAPRTAALFVPFSNRLDEASVTLSDPVSGRSIPALDQNNPSEPPQLLGQPVNFGETFVGVSGNDQTRSLLEGQFRQNNLVCGYLKPLFLPSVAAGYDALDLLLLNGPDLGRLDLDQQRAIVEWVKSGGILVIWPGTSPLPDGSPLLDALPCKFGEVRTYELTPAQLKSVGLPNRFAHLSGRSIAAVANGARDIHPIAGSDLLGYRKWVGFGQIVALPADVSSFVFNSPADAQAFWKTTLTGVIALPEAGDEQSNQYNQYNSNDESRRMQAAQSAMDWMSNIPGAGRFGFSYLAIALGTMMFVVGPVDWFVLKWMGRQPWTWATTSGWILLVTLGAISVGYLLKSGDLHFRTVSLVDESDGARVAQTTLAAIYSPRTREYALKFDPQGWWRPAGENGYHSARGLQLEVDCRQDYRGNRPKAMLINVWNLRFLEGSITTPASGMIAANLTQYGGKIQGSIMNQSAVALTHVSVQTQDGTIQLSGTINPGATMPVSEKLRHNAAPANPQPYGVQPMTRFGLPMAGDISVVRSNRIRSMLQDRDDVACVYAEYEAPPAEVKLDEPEAKQQHLGMVRSLVRLK